MSVGRMIYVVVLSWVISMGAVAQTVESEDVLTPPPAPAEVSVPLATLTPPSNAASSAYMAMVTGNSVNIRSGPAEVYYSVGQLNKGEKVIVVEELKGVKNWVKVLPTSQCFSYIAKEFVSVKDASAVQPAGVTPPGTGTEPVKADVAASAPPIGKEVVMGVVIGENVRVRSGSNRISPVHASEVQTVLPKGAEVRILGQQDDFYKIVPPDGCYFYVLQDFVKKEGPVTDQAKIEMLAQAGQYLIGGAAKSSPATATATTSTATRSQSSTSERQVYLDAIKMVEALQAKPVKERDFTAVKQKLEQLLQSDSAVMKRYATNLAKIVIQMETAQEVVVRANQQDSNLKMTLDQINDKYQKLVSSMPPMTEPGDLIIKGRLVKSAIFTSPLKNQRYVVLDDQDNILYYAVGAADGVNLADWLGKRVSMAGRAEYDGFGKVHVLQVKGIVEIPNSQPSAVVETKKEVAAPAPAAPAEAKPAPTEPESEEK